MSSITATNGRDNPNPLRSVPTVLLAKRLDPGRVAGTIVERLDLQEQWMLARLEGTRTIKSTLSKLYETLSDDQKKSANELFAPHMGMGMMAIMPEQAEPSQMQPGQIRPGAH